jgi:hypothetical protein
MKNFLTNKCKISLDGTDCPIQEPQPFNKKYFSHKFHGPGLKYKIGVCITTGWVCWYNGPKTQVVLATQKSLAHYKS